MGWPWDPSAWSEGRIPIPRIFAWNEYHDTLAVRGRWPAAERDPEAGPLLSLRVSVDAVGWPPGRRVALAAAPHGAADSDVCDPRLKSRKRLRCMMRKSEKPEAMSLGHRHEVRGAAVLGGGIPGTPPAAQSRRRFTGRSPSAACPIPGTRSPGERW